MVLPEAVAGVTPITKVYDADGELVHDCKAAGCDASWDGYDLATGQRLEGATDPGPEWDTSTEGVARPVRPDE